MIILSSPSGAGKTTLVKLLSKKKNFFISVDLGVLVVWDIDVIKFFLSDKSLTRVVFPAPDGDERIIIIPSLIGVLKINYFCFQ